MDQDTILREMAEKVSKLEAENQLLRAGSQFVGVRNNFEGDIYIPVLGGNRITGDDDIRIPGKEARPVPLRTWEWMVTNNHVDIRSGQLVRDDSILGAYGKAALGVNLGEKEKFPDGIIDQEISATFKMKVPDFKNRLRIFTQRQTIARMMDLANETSPKPFKHIEALRDRFDELNTIFPANFEKLDKNKLIALAYDYDIPKFIPEDFDSLDAMREFIRDGLKRIEDIMKKKQGEE